MDMNVDDYVDDYVDVDDLQPWELNLFTNKQNERYVNERLFSLYSKPKTEFELYDHYDRYMKLFEYVVFCLLKRNRQYLTKRNMISDDECLCEYYLSPLSSEKIRQIASSSLLFESVYDKV
jgi:hypothetical protein